MCTCSLQRLYGYLGTEDFLPNEQTSVLAKEGAMLAFLWLKQACGSDWLNLLMA